MRNSSSERKVLARKTLSSIKSKIILYNKTPVMSSRVDLADDFDEIRDLSLDRKNARQTMQAKASINNTLDEFS